MRHGPSRLRPWRRARRRSPPGRRCALPPPLAPSAPRAPSDPARPRHESRCCPKSPWRAWRSRTSGRTGASRPPASEAAASQHRSREPRLRWMRRGRRPCLRPINAQKILHSHPQRPERPQVVARLGPRVRTHWNLDCNCTCASSMQPWKTGFATTPQGWLFGTGKALTPGRTLMPELVSATTWSSWQTPACQRRGRGRGRQGRGQGRPAAPGWTGRRESRSTPAPRCWPPAPAGAQGRT